MLNGLTFKEISERMERIIDFADIGESIDKPLKTYSSGMIVRVAVIANLDADLLIVDEALAVGDAFFTQKCMRYIQNFRKQWVIICKS